jgi:hypothetical protein
MAISLLRAEKFLNIRLTENAKIAANVGSKVAGYSVLDGTKPPYVIWQFIIGRGLKVVGNIKVWDELEYIVKAICAGHSFAPVAQAVEGIEEAMNCPVLIVDGGNVSSHTTDPIIYEETDPKTQEKYRHIGYRVILKAQ